MLSTLKRERASGLLFIAFIVALASCAPAPLPTPTMPPPTAVPPTPTPVPVYGAVSVADQPIVDGAVTVLKVNSSYPGWVVIHAQTEGAEGPAIGHAPVKAGDNFNISVPITTSTATPVLYAMLHIDKGTIGVYQFPGPDTSIIAERRLVSAPFYVTGGLYTPSISVFEQPIVNGKISASAVSDGAGWLVIRNQKGSVAGDDIGHIALKMGENVSVTVPIDVSMATELLFATLLVDKGKVGTLELPGPDVPAIAFGAPVVSEFFLTGGLSTWKPALSATDQPMVNGTVTLPRVVSDGPGWVVVYNSGGVSPGNVIGERRVRPGENISVTVHIDTQRATQDLTAQLHANLGGSHEFEFPGVDAPILVGGKSLSASFKLTGELPASEVDSPGTVVIEMVDNAFVPERVSVPVGTTVRWINLDSVGHTTTSDANAVPSSLPLWDSWIMLPTQTFTRTFADPGTFGYYCRIYGYSGGGSMYGIITVK